MTKFDKENPRCPFCFFNGKLIKRVTTYNADCDACPVCGHNDPILNFEDLLCTKCGTKAPQALWPKKSPDKYYFKCPNCKSEIHHEGEK